MARARRGSSPCASEYSSNRRLELERGAVRAGGDQRRRQMADRRRADPSLGLRRLAGIVDDERIDHRRRADEDLRRASTRQRDGLARQPFERAVRAELDEGVDPLAAREPEVEGDIGVARGKRQAVIVALATERVAPVRLDGDDQLAEADKAEAECPVDQARIADGIAPCGADGALEFRRTGGELRLVFGEAQSGLERTFGERRDQRGRVAIGRHVIAGGAQDSGDGGGARRRVETDGIARAAAARRIVRQHAGEALVGGRLCA